MKSKGKTMFLILLYVLLSVGGLLLLKIGTKHDLAIGITNGVINFKINFWIIAGMCIYVCSFIVSILAMSSTDLSVFYPISAGLGYIGVCILSYFILKEVISMQQFIGMIVILIGILVMNYKV